MALCDENSLTSQPGIYAEYAPACFVNLQKSEPKSWGHQSPSFLEVKGRKVILQPGI
jgi:hypothetical protein